MINVNSMKGKGKKPDNVKRDILNQLMKELKVTEIINPEREFIINWNGETYKITLMKPRT